MLFASALAGALAHSFVDWPSLNLVHATFMAGGLVTSLLNHCKFFRGHQDGLRALDRLVVRTGFCVDLYVCIQKENAYSFFLITCSGISYVISKYTGKKYFHVGAHCLATAGHILI